MQITSLQDILDEKYKKVYLATRAFTHYTPIKTNGFADLSKLEKIDIDKSISLYEIIGDKIILSTHANYIEAKETVRYGTKEAYTCMSHNTLYLYNKPERKLFSTLQEAEDFSNLPPIDLSSGMN